MNFNLNNVSGNAVTTLKAWDIYTVVFKGLEVVKGTGSNGDWKAFKFKVSGDKGTFEPMFFCPNAEGDKRKSGTSNDGKPWEMPSALESLQFAVSHIITKLAPEQMAKLAKACNSINLPEDFEKLVEYMQVALKGALNKQTQIKLIGNNKGYASIPNFVSINKEGIAYISNNWLGDNLSFTAAELKKKETIAKAKPTPINNATPNDLDNTNDDLDSIGDENSTDFDI